MQLAPGGLKSAKSSCSPFPPDVSGNVSLSYLQYIAQTLPDSNMTRTLHPSILVKLQVLVQCMPQHSLETATPAETLQCCASRLNQLARRVGEGVVIQRGWQARGTLPAVDVDAFVRGGDSGIAK